MPESVDPNKRICADWLKGYLEYTEGQESPDIFHLWCGISVIASTLERNVWLDRGYYTLFPNMFIVLVSGSAAARRSTAILTAARLQRNAIPDIPTFSQKVTPEAIISSLSDSFKKRGVSAGYIVADEMSTFMGNGQKDGSLVQILTKLYDGSDFDYHTIMRGKEICHKPCCNMLAGSTPEWLKESFPVHSIGGGFTGRIIFVHHKGSGRKVAFPKLSDKERALIVNLTSDLKAVREMSGEYILTAGATAWFEHWYTKVHDVDDCEPSLRGYMARKHDTLLKVAMNVAASRRQPLVVEETDLVVAEGMMKENEKFLPEAMRLIMSTQVGEEARRVFNIILRKKETSYADLMRATSYFVNAKMLSDILDSLKDSEMIQERMDGPRRIYSVKGI